MAVGQKTVVANALKAAWKSMLQEPPDELLGRQSHHLLLLSVAVIFPLERDLAIFERQQTPIGNSHAMSVAAQILQHMLRPAKGGLGVNHPLGFFQRSQITGESGRVAQRFQIAEELELAGGINFFQGFEQQSPEQAAEDLDWQKESGAAWDPAVVVSRQAAAGNDAVQVGMKVKILTPAMEYRQEAHFHTQTFGVAGNGEQGFSGGAEQEVVNNLFIVEGDGGDGLGECEDHVEVLGGQQLGLALPQPLFPCQALALGAMAIAARAVDSVRLLTVVAPFDSPAQYRRAASLDGLHQAMLI